MKIAIKSISDKDSLTLINSNLNLKTFFFNTPYSALKTWYLNINSRKKDQLVRYCFMERHSSKITSIDIENINQ